MYTKQNIISTVTPNPKLNIKRHNTIHTQMAINSPRLASPQADVNVKDTGYTALIESSSSGHLEVCKLLIECQANVNEKDFLWYDARPLHMF